MVLYPTPFTFPILYAHSRSHLTSQVNRRGYKVQHKGTGLFIPSHLSTPTNTVNPPVSNISNPQIYSPSPILWVLFAAHPLRIFYCWTTLRYIFFYLYFYFCCSFWGSWMIIWAFVVVLWRASLGEGINNIEGIFELWGNAFCVRGGRICWWLVAGFKTNLGCF